MSTVAVVPRWEWRMFGDDGAEAFAGLTPDRVQESDELYILSTESDASVKVRDGQLDVKLLEHVDETGLEQWRPVLKAPFPLDQVQVHDVLAALGVETPRLRRESYTLDQLLREVVARIPALRAVDVHKRREHYTVERCMAELSQVQTREGVLRTIAVESEEAALVLRTVRLLGLSPARNVCLARGLKAQAGIGLKRFAVIDVGTNSVKFHLGERRADGVWTTVVDRAEVTRLGEGMTETGHLNPEPVERTLEAIEDMVEEARNLGVSEIAAVGTAGLRAAPNRDVFVRAVRDRSRIGLEVISGDDEARLAYLAATAEIDVGTGISVVFDTGGGSSQFTFGHAGRIDDRFSIDVGAVRFTENFHLDGPVGGDVIMDVRAAIETELGRLRDHLAPQRVVAMGGTVTNLAAVKHALVAYDPDVVQGTVLDRAEIDRQIGLYRARTAEQRRRIVGLQPARAEVILAGACIVRTVLETLGAEQLTVSDRGLRHGVLAERFGR